MKKQDNNLHTEMGTRLKYHRTYSKITIEQLAEKIDTTPRYLQDVERGKVGMSLTTFKTICEVLEISADSLLFGEPAGIDALLRGVERGRIELIEELVRLQLRIISQK